MIYQVRFGRSDIQAEKSVFHPQRSRALHLANALSYVLFSEHKFRASQCKGSLRIEEGGFFIEYSEVEGTFNDRTSRQAEEYKDGL